MTYIHTGKFRKVLKKVNNVIYICTLFMHKLKYKANIFGASNFKGKIDTVYSKHFLYTIDKNDIITGEFEGRRFEFLKKYLSLVKGTPNNVINIREYIGKA